MLKKCDQKFKLMYKEFKKNPKNEDENTIC